MFNIIGDIAGQYKTLRALLDKMPEGTPVSVGDMVDRGPDSRSVVEFFMENGLAIKGNHEDMMVDYCLRGNLCEYNTRFRWSVWLGNGGEATLESYGVTEFDGNPPEEVPEEHVKWLENLPSVIEHEDEFGKLIVTHAPINPVYGIDKLKKIDLKEDHSLAWNRGNPRQISGAVQIYGHNANRNVQYHGSLLAPWGINIDTSRAKILTGVHWPTLEIYQQEYLD